MRLFTRLALLVVSLIVVLAVPAAWMARKTVTRILNVEEGEYERLGSTCATKVDVRILAATHRDLPAQVEAEKFREDLLFRLNVIRLEVPPLRERAGDVRLLGEHFLVRSAADRKRPIPTLQEESWRLLNAYAWPGNVRELKNVVERLVILGRGAEIGPEDLPREITRGRPGRGGGAPVREANSYVGLTLQAARAALERDLIQAALKRHGGNVTRAAGELGLERSNLHPRITALGLGEE